MRVVLAALLACACMSQTPSPPIYPPVFSVQFFETQITTSGTGETYGQSFYDSVHNVSRFDRFNGNTDIMCSQGLQANVTTPCSHYVVQDNRYLFYPNLNSCCYCCNGTNGCGLLRDNWLTNSQYLGQLTYAGTQVYGWNQSNSIYFETAVPDATQRIPVGLERINPDPGVVMELLQFLEYVPEVPANVFDLPSQCSSTPLCSGACANFRTFSEILTS